MPSIILCLITYWRLLELTCANTVTSFTPSCRRGRIKLRLTLFRGGPTLWSSFESELKKRTPQKAGGSMPSVAASIGGRVNALR